MIKNVLIFNPLGIGDVLFSTPLVRAIKENYPQACITYVCNKRAQGILKDNPRISKIYIFEKDDYRAVWGKSKIKGLVAVSAFLNTLKKDRYDLVFDMTLGNMASLLLALIVHVPRRIGFNYKNRLGLLTDKVPLEGFHDKHAVEYYLDLGAPLGLRVTNRQMELFISEADRVWADDYLARHGIMADMKICGLLPGCGVSWGADAKYRRWESPKFAEVADHAASKYGYKIIIFGEKSEANICTDVASRMKETSIEMCGKTSLGQFAALLARCDLVIANDGGPLHMAVALKKKLVGVYGPVDVRVYGPYPPNSRYETVTSNDPCRPCYKNFRHRKCGSVDCLAHITPEMVMRAVDRVVGVAA